MRRRVLGFGACCYHITSRISEDRFYLGTDQKKVFRDLLRRCVGFSGVELLAFCIMDNHFHLLVHVPVEKEISDAELMRRLKLLYTKEEYEDLANEFSCCMNDSTGRSRRLFRMKYMRRMYDLSEFMSTLKQRFSIWYNKTRRRNGPLWNGRFRSVLVQSSKDERGVQALLILAAYIDLNAVRAGLVKAPENYPWCSYAEAAAGDCVACKGLLHIYGKGRHRIASGAAARRRYGEMLSGICRGEILRCSFPKRALLPLRALLTTQSQCLSRGWLFGDKAFVEFVTRRRPECFSMGRMSGYATPATGAEKAWYTAATV